MVRRRKKKRNIFTRDDYKKAFELKKEGWTYVKIGNYFSTSEGTCRRWIKKIEEEKQIEKEEKKKESNKNPDELLVFVCNFIGAKLTKINNKHYSVWFE
jgi:hypothetical protein